MCSPAAFTAPATLGCILPHATMRKGEPHFKFQMPHRQTLSHLLPESELKGTQSALDQIKSAPHFKQYQSTNKNIISSSNIGKVKPKTSNQSSVNVSNHYSPSTVPPSPAVPKPLTLPDGLPPLGWKHTTKQTMPKKHFQWLDEMQLTKFKESNDLRPFLPAALSPENVCTPECRTAHWKIEALPPGKTSQRGCSNYD